MQPTKKLELKNIFDIEDLIEEKRHHSVVNFKWGESYLYLQEWAYLGTTCVSTTFSLKRSTTLDRTKVIGNDGNDEFDNNYTDITSNEQNLAYAVNDGRCEGITTEASKVSIVNNDIQLILTKMGYCLECLQEPCEWVHHEEDCLDADDDFRMDNPNLSTE